MSIDLLYEGIIDKLKTQGKIANISEELLSLTTNEDRVLYVYELIKETGDFPKVKEVHKSSNVSKYYRNSGNEYYVKSKDYMALQYFNLALLHAPLESDQYALALGNRSAAFYSMKKYKECKQDIQTILSMEYPEKMKEKILKREAMCDEAIKEKPLDLNEFGGSGSGLEHAYCKMENAINPRYPCASSKLEVRYNKEMGRHVVAKEDIKVGEVLAKENPYTSLPLKSQYLFICSYCLSRNLSLLPCDNCCFALYCSDKCKENAKKEYHGIECRLMPMLVDMEFTKLELLALRITIKARTDHENWHSLFKTIEEAEIKLNSENRGHVNGVFDSKYYASIHTLASNVEKRSVSDIFQKSITAAVFLKFLNDDTDFMKCEDDDRNKIRRCVAGTLLHHIMTCPTNMHGISFNVQNIVGNYVNETNIGCAPYAFHSLLNHSCSPNVVRYCELGTAQMTLFALRPIKKGKQLFDNYGSHHALEDRKSRRETLKFQYKFDCHCEACTDDWPTYLLLGPSETLPISLKKQKEALLCGETIRKLQKGDQMVAFNLYKPLSELTETMEPYAPCSELADCQETLKQCMSIFCGVVPYGYSQVLQWNAFPPSV